LEIIPYFIILLKGYNYEINYIIGNVMFIERLLKYGN
jgi:hypothetical protein